jgi:type 1 fimbria pilin
MKLHLTQQFFVLLSAIVFLLSLSSCGKDYDLVSEYVVRDTAQKVLLSNTQESTDLGINVLNGNSNLEVKKK